ncbi:unnamed protein product (macronuclear) [Paramecium tetraurelia]|uniref:Uncharacterized protein n=1 Tax=Paramecium tetraurelia TaxID=5888 RepID=A0D4R3_PARTE|nr:uncharacterized protein GSPATT00013477001 [Paramecium tetraurelia]CAK78030.1 unnamed protein product [Paramecium tetraurelia]|eukprot:XP_001445427.1 hypothetical protein (macronuclear) [Paramecium tetraurelia strain d4-2]
MGSSCNSIKQEQNSVEQDIPEQEGQIKGITQNCVVKKKYFGLKNDQQIQEILQIEKKSLYIPIESQQNYILFHSILYQSEIAKSKTSETSRKYQLKKINSKIKINNKNIQKEEYHQRQQKGRIIYSQNFKE